MITMGSTGITEREIIGEVNTNRTWDGGKTYENMKTHKVDIEGS